MATICSIYRSPKKEGMYLYVCKAEGLQRVPDALLTIFGRPEHAMTLLLRADRKLARVNKDEVEKALLDQGYFLQMPPGKEDYMLDLYNPHKS